MNLRKWNRKGLSGMGLVGLWVSIGLTVFILLMIYNVVLPILGMTDNMMYGYVTQNGGWSLPWILSWTNNGTWILHDAVPILFYGVLIAIVAVGIIVSLQREPSEQTFQI